MSSRALPAEPPAIASPEDDAAHFRQVLREVVDVGVDLLRMIQQQAKTGAANDAAIAYERVSRTIRRTMLLAGKLAEPVPAARIPAARRQIIRAVEDTIQRTCDDDEAGALHEELLDRLDGPDVEDDIGERPVAEIIAEICRDLGLAALPGTHPWKRRTPEDIATLYARAASRPPHSLRGIRATPPPTP